MDAEHRHQGDRGEPVQHAGGGKAAHAGRQRLSPTHERELERHAGDGEYEEADQHDQVQRALEGRESLVKAVPDRRPRGKAQSTRVAGRR